MPAAKRARKSKAKAKDQPPEVIEVDLSDDGSSGEEDSGSGNDEASSSERRPRRRSSAKKINYAEAESDDDDDGEKSKVGIVRKPPKRVSKPPKAKSAQQIFVARERAKIRRANSGTKLAAKELTAQANDRLRLVNCFWVAWQAM